MGSFVTIRGQAPVVELVFDRAERRNAITSPEDCQQFAGALSELDADTSVRCIILTGAGSAFSAGGDIKAMKERRGIGPQDQALDTRLNYKRGVHRVIHALWHCETPIIAAINGPAVGLGLDIACLCDQRIAADSARFGSTFVKLGIIPGDGGAWILPRIIGLANASELILSGDLIDAQRALEIGLIKSAVPAEQLLEQAHELAQRIAANPPRATALAKRLLREGQTGSLNGVLEMSAAFQALLHETEDHAEAVDAMLEKRSAEFKGR